MKTSYAVLQITLIFREKRFLKIFRLKQFMERQYDKTNQITLKYYATSFSNFNFS